MAPENWRSATATTPETCIYCQANHPHAVHVSSLEAAKLRIRPGYLMPEADWSKFEWISWTRFYGPIDDSQMEEVYLHELADDLMDDQPRCA